jgi:predicted ATP-grasp superfamily ATP-dependent carboligase
MPKHSPLLILGASIRAAAASAVRAGLQPSGADLFCDTDLPKGAFQRVDDYPDGFLEIAKDGPAGPWMYTGALENRSELVARISEQRSLWGNPPDVLDEVRSPQRVCQILRAASLPCPNVSNGAKTTGEGDWLLKPRNGSAGHGIRRWGNGSTPLPRAHYLQELIEGEPCAAIYVGGDRGAEYLGTTRQLVGQEWLHAKNFQYCGSIGLMPLAPQTQNCFASLGIVLADAFRLRGLFGVDCILRDGVPFPVEVNPRYTASVEVLELARGISALDLHRRAFVSMAEIPRPNRTVPTQLVGKAILFARAALRFPAQGPWLPPHAPLDPWAIPPFADIPAVGTVIPRGKPILTFFATARAVEECEERLRQIACNLDRRLFGP